VTLSWQHSCIVYLFLFAWWQHRFDVVNSQTHKQTNRQTKMTDLPAETVIS